MVTILFKVVEALHFGGFGEFSPTVRGPAALGKVLTIPSPTTILGLLTYLVQGIKQNASGTLREDYDILKSNLKCSELYIRGPYLIVNNELCTVIDNLVINLENTQAKNGIFKYLTNVFAKILGKEDEVESVTKELEEYQLNIIKFLGVGLKRDLKISDEDRGLLYLAEYVDYSIIGHLEKKLYETYIAIDLIGKDLSLEKLKRFDKQPVRLGGESRITQMFINENVSKFVDLCHKFLETESDYYLLFHIIPTVIDVPEDRMYIDCEYLSQQLFGSKDVVIGCIGKFGKDPIGIIGLGFNEVKKVRRPLKYAILPGSITIVKNIDKSKLSEICKKGIECNVECDGVKCNEIGFNTILPIPIKKLDEKTRKYVEQLIKILESG